MTMEQIQISKELEKALSKEKLEALKEAKLKFKSAVTGAKKQADFKWAVETFTSDINRIYFSENNTNTDQVRQLIKPFFIDVFRRSILDYTNKQQTMSQSSVCFSHDFCKTLEATLTTKGPFIDHERTSLGQFFVKVKRTSTRRNTLPKLFEKIKQHSQKPPANTRKNVYPVTMGSPESRITIKIIKEIFEEKNIPTAKGFFTMRQGASHGKRRSQKNRESIREKSIKIKAYVNDKDVQLVASGAFGTVYCFTVNGSKKRLKISRRDQSDNLKKEVENSKKAATIFGRKSEVIHISSRDGDNSMLIDDFVEGEDLQKTLLKKYGKLSFSDGDKATFANDFFQILKSATIKLKILHERDYMHGDISEKNLVVSTPKNVNFIDWASLKEGADDTDKKIDRLALLCTFIGIANKYGMLLPESMRPIKKFIKEAESGQTLISYREYQNIFGLKFRDNLAAQRDIRNGTKEASKVKRTENSKEYKKALGLDGHSSIPSLDEIIKICEKQLTYKDLPTIACK
jgi:tRNA A-37 threonylcarbamoyl transferase component Bud32